MFKLKSLARRLLSPVVQQKIEEKDAPFVIVSDEDAPAIIAENLKNANNDLEKIVYSNTDRRIFKWHHYLPVYDRYFSPVKDLAKASTSTDPSEFAPGGVLRILEIGVQNGGSLQMWRKYFGPDAVIFGIDIDPKCAGFATETTQVRIGDQSSDAFLKSVVEEMGGVDIVIDDGSHIASHQLASFRCLFPMLTNGGLYVCEDLHTAYWDGWEGGFRRPGTFIEVGKSVIDHMHEWYAGIDTELNDMNLKETVLGIGFYDSVLVVEKGKKERPYAIHVGQDSFAEQ